MLADPANVTELCGTHDDILIPSSCLNCTVSGLISRTFLRDDIISKDDYHGAVYYGELANSDLSYDFINAIESQFEMNSEISDNIIEGLGIDEVRKIAHKFRIDDINFIKPGIGETTRVLLRRVPWKVLINTRFKDDKSLAHIIRLAEEKNVPVEYYPLVHYKACGIIKKLQMHNYNPLFIINSNNWKFIINRRFYCTRKLHPVYTRCSFKFLTKDYYILVFFLFG